MARPICCALALVMAFAVSTGAAEFPADRLDAITKKPALRHALWGILVEDEAGKVLYARNADTRMIPASVRKLFTAASVLACHGTDGVLETTAGITGVMEGATLRGDLVIRGGGDPSLGGRWEYGADRNARLQLIVDALRRLGIARIDGDVVVDVSAFDDERIPGSWKTENLGRSWAAAVDAIALNENVIGVRVDGRPPARAVVTLDPYFATYVLEERCSRAQHVVGILPGNVVNVRCARDGRGTLSYLVAVDDPALFAGSGVRSMLLAQGIAVRGVRTTREPVEGVRPIAVIASPPIGTMLGAILADSANLYSEMLLKSMSSGGGTATYAESLGIERAFLVRAVGLEDGEFSFDDGSGLSVENAVTPRATARLLRYLESDRARFRIFIDTVAVPGDGTLRRRLEGLEGRVYAKTGTINGVAALAGWVLGREGGRRRFVVLINHHATTGKTATDAIDDIVRLVAEF